MGGCTELRCEVRVKLLEPLPSSVGFNDTCFPAELVDVSQSGAQFHFQDCDSQLDIAQGREIYSTVWLPSGKLTRFRAASRWFHRLHGGYSLGVKFLETVNEVMAGDFVQKPALPA